MLRSIRFYFYLFGYMIIHPFVLARGMKALRAGDFAVVDAITAKHVTRWCEGLRRRAGTEITLTGAENLPTDRACVIAANHRSMYDTLLMLTLPCGPIPLVSKIENQKIPYIRQWMALLHCLFLDRNDVRQSVHVLDEAAELIRQGYHVGIFPEGTRYKGEEGGIGEFLGGAFRIASKTGAPVVPVAIHNSRACLEIDGKYTIKRAHVAVHILPPIETEGLDRAGIKALPGRVQAMIAEDLQKGM